MEYTTKELIKVVSGIDKIWYLKGIMYFTLSDYPLELWYGPCEKELYDIICEEIEESDEFTFWEWTYSRKNKEIHKWKYNEKTYLRA